MKRVNCLSKAIVSAAACWLAGSGLAANLVVNGDFEDEPLWNQGITYDAGFTAFIDGQIPGWTIEPGHAVTVHNTLRYPFISGNYSVNVDGEGAFGQNGNFYQDIASQDGAQYHLTFDWKCWYQDSTPSLEVSLEDTATQAVLYKGTFKNDALLHHESAGFTGTGNPVRLRVRENPQSGYNDNVFIVDNFSVTADATNRPPTLACPTPVETECDVSVITLMAGVSDPDGDALTVVWSLNGVAVQTNEVPAVSPPVSGVALVSFSADFAMGTNLVGVSVTDGQATVGCTTTVTVVDTSPPVLSEVAVSPAVLWPPDHRFVSVRVSAQATDNCSGATWKIVGVESNESVNGLGDGNTSSDWRISGPDTVWLRAERSGGGRGRIYTILVQAVDSLGNVSLPARVTVSVPKSGAS